MLNNVEYTLSLIHSRVAKYNHKLTLQFFVLGAPGSLSTEPSDQVDHHDRIDDAEHCEIYVLCPLHKFILCDVVKWFDEGFDWREGLLQQLEVLFHSDKIYNCNNNCLMSFLKLCEYCEQKLTRIYEIIDV